MPLLWLSLAFLGGILSGAILAWPVKTWLELAALALAGEIILRLLSRASVFRSFRRKFYSYPLLASLAAPLSYTILFAALALGAARYRSVQPEITPGFIGWYNDGETPFIVEGILRAQPDDRDTYTNLRVEADQLHLVGEWAFTPVEGTLLARVPPGGDWRYGDRVRLQGWLQTPFENEEFSYRDYLARQGVYAYLSCANKPEGCARLLRRGQGNPILAAIYDLRIRALEVVYRLFPDPEASLMAGILLGIESGIPEDVQQAFNQTGTTHIIAISGFNFAIVAGLFVALFGRLLGRWRGMLAAFVAIALYAGLAGATPSVVRAAIMGGMSVLAVQLGRRQNGLNSLAFVAALMALADPNVLWDVGFQLSFMATLGLILYADPLTQGFTRIASPRLPATTVQRLAGPVGEFFLFTLAAQLTTLPIVIYYFRRLSLVSLLANPLVLPAQPPVMVLGGLAVIAGLIYLPLGQVLSYLAWPFVVYTIRGVELLAGISGGNWVLGQVSLLAVLGFYVLLLGWTFGGERLRNWTTRRFGGQPILPGYSDGLALAGLSIVTVVAWQMVFAAPDGRLHLTVLDIGSGDALLVQTPTGRNLLIDGGASPNRLSDGLGRRLPLNGRRLDYLVVAATGDEQVAALPRTLERFPPDHVLWAGPPAGTYEALKLSEFLAERRIPVVQAQVGQVLDLGAGARLEVLAATRRGAVLLLEWGNFRTLLPVGLDFEGLEALLGDHTQPPVTALLLADGGYAPLNPPEWIERWRPQVVLLSVAAGDEQGRPDPETLRALEGRTLLRTDQNGWVELNTDGEQLWVEVEKR